MDAPCDASTLIIPADPSFVAVAQAYATAVAARLGFDPAAQVELQEAVGLALRDILARAFEPGERQSLTLASERLPAGLRLVITESGLPLSLADLPALTPVQTGRARLADLVDEVSLSQRGHAGTELHLVKYLPAPDRDAYIRTCQLPPPADALPPPVPGLGTLPGLAASHPCQVRRFSPADALEVARTVYKAYGYSYPFEDMYYPERLSAHNAAGRLVSAVAVAPSGEVIGHAALLLFDAASAIVEVGLAAVKPAARGQGCLTRLTEFLRDEARRRGYTAVYARTVTSHTVSQKVTAHLGFTPVGLMLGFGPATLSFRHLREHLPQRESLLVEYLPLQPVNPGTLYLPERHREMLAALYRRLGAHPELSAAPCALPPDVATRSLTRLKSRALPTGFAAIIMQDYGSDAVTAVHARLQDLIRQHYEVIFLYLDLADPLTCALGPQFEALGFFFAGLLPGAHGLQALLLQYLNSASLDYDRIQIHAPAARNLLAYIRRADPNRP